MNQSNVSLGVTLSWETEHRDKDGNLISRQCSVRPPQPPTCLTFRCLARYTYQSIYFALLVEYHKRRIMYAEANRRKKILDRYRTGEPSPANLWQAIHALIKLRCGVCRKYNRDPLLFSTIYKEVRDARTRGI